LLYLPNFGMRYRTRNFEQGTRNVERRIRAANIPGFFKMNT